MDSLYVRKQRHMEQPRRITLKARDPRRAFYEATFQLNRKPQHEHHNTDGVSTHGNTVITIVQRQEKLSQTSTSQSATTLDIDWNLAGALKRRREFVSLPQDHPERGKCSKPCNPDFECYNIKFQQSGALGYEKTTTKGSCDHKKNDIQILQHQQRAKSNSLENTQDTCTKSAGAETGEKTVPKECLMGSYLTQDEWRDVEQLIQHQGYNDHQKDELIRERGRRIHEHKEMLATRKLSLVLSLEHTLLHPATISDLPRISYYNKLRDMVRQDSQKEQRHLFKFEDPVMWIRLRRGIWKFLEKASKLYELHLYTMGNKKFAAKVVKELDPNGILFAGRIICREDDSDNVGGKGRNIKNLDEVKGLESSVVIMDNSESAWPHNRKNLIVVERYNYFPSKECRDRHKLDSLLKRDCDEGLVDGTLASCLKVLERIHHNFFAQLCFNHPDVRHILASEKRRVLVGCRILFSGFFKCGEPNPQKHQLWRLSEQFGAECRVEMDKEITHIVARKGAGRSDKVKWGLSEGKFVVNERWIMASTFLYRRDDEHRHRHSRIT